MENSVLWYQILSMYDRESVLAIECMHYYNPCIQSQAMFSLSAYRFISFLWTLFHPSQYGEAGCVVTVTWCLTINVGFNLNASKSLPVPSIMPRKPCHNHINKKKVYDKLINNVLNEALSGFSLKQPHKDKPKAKFFSRGIHTCGLPVCWNWKQVNRPT